MKIGIFGGTFNPPHNAHVEMARAAKIQLGLDKLMVFPCGDPPHKFCALDKHTRMNLARLAFGGFCEVDGFELEGHDKSYTVNTLKYVRDKFPKAKLYLIIGGDSLRDFDTWHRPEEIASMCSLAVAARKNVETDVNAEKVRRLYGCEVCFLETPLSGISSSEIRLKYNFLMDCSEEVPCEIDSYVKKAALYSQYTALTSRLRSDYLNSERYSHTFYVTKAGLEIKSDVPRGKVFLACALHDCAKFIGEDRYEFYRFQRGNLPKAVVHAFLGALVAEKDFGVADEEILDAIRYHTTARPNMTQLDMIVYVADKTEESRPYPTAHLIKQTLEETFSEVLKEAVVCVGGKTGGEIHPLTKEALAFYGISADVKAQLR